MTRVAIAGFGAIGRELAAHLARGIPGVELAAVASLRDVVSIRAYLTSLDSYADHARVRRERFGDALPASAAVRVAGLLEGALVEVEAIAFVPAG